MILIAIYIENYSIFRDQLLTFSSDYRVTRTVGTNHDITLSVKYEKNLPSNFFSSNSPNKGCVSSVSAIIGQNGSGKTTIARLLCSLAPWGKRLRVGNVVVLVEIDEELQVYTSYPRDDVHIEVSGGKVLHSIYSSMDEKFEAGPLPFKFFYYSPHYTTEQSDWDLGNEGDSTFNISTTWLMWHPEGNSETLLPRGVSSLLVYNIDEKLRVLEFCREYAAKALPDRGTGRRSKASDKCTHGLHNVLKQFKIPIPQKVSIMPHYAGVSQAIADMGKRVGPKKKLGPSDQVGNFLNGILDSFDIDKPCQDCFTSAFVAYAVRYFQNCGLLAPSFSSAEIQKGSFLEALHEFIRKHQWNKAIPPRHVISFLKTHVPPLNAMTLQNPQVRDTTPYAADFFACLAKLCKLANHKDSGVFLWTQHDGKPLFFCQTSNLEARKTLYQLIGLHGISKVISPFLSFEIYPPMSSGEMAFLSMFSRLFSFISKDTQPNDNVMIFLDEAETTLHPQWQRRLVEYFIRFLEVFIPNRHFQLVFASHSPILLSDLPADNCCFLKFPEIDEQHPADRCTECVKLQTSGKFSNTFGANIYDLFSHSFFLADGPVGEFSSRVIDEHLTKIATRANKACEQGRDRDNAPDEDMALTQALIGDRMLVRYYEVLKNHGLI